ncbi:cordon-bleu protein-like 1b isoform X1 [Triplophysa rosa]|uniref:cordon-bleu protein-like 1b isoform X1 n=1 Tax=Triplophysa rosa TaxID=992332 RepID=UPI002546377A|nr:cordon-bleu protein-like 1b isoform X1 [Triplophysa rosa]
MKVDSSAQHRGRSSAVNLTAAAGMDGDARNRRRSSKHKAPSPPPVLKGLDGPLLSHKLPAYPHPNMDQKENLLDQDLTLTVVLPGGVEKTTVVHGSKPMMDLLVTLCAKHHLNPSGHTIELITTNRNHVKFKPNALIGALEAEKILLKPKGLEDRSKKTGPQMPEATVRLVINYKKTQKTILRVSPRVPLRELLPAVCEKCEFDPQTTVLLRNVHSEDTLDLNCSLNDFGLREVYARDTRVFSPVSPVSLPPSPTRSDTIRHRKDQMQKEKENKGLFGLFRKGSRKQSEQSMTVSAPASPVQRKHRPVSMSSFSAHSPTYDYNTLPSDMPKKRRAPLPPGMMSQSMPADLSHHQGNPETAGHLDGNQSVAPLSSVPSTESCFKRTSTKRKAPPPPALSAGAPPDEAAQDRSVTEVVLACPLEEIREQEEVSVPRELEDNSSLNLSADFSIDSTTQDSDMERVSLHGTSRDDPSRDLRSADPGIPEVAMNGEVQSEQVMSCHAQSETDPLEERKEKAAESSESSLVLEKVSVSASETTGSTLNMPQTFDCGIQTSLSQSQSLESNTVPPRSCPEPSHSPLTQKTNPTDPTALSNIPSSDVCIKPPVVVSTPSTGPKRDRATSTEELHVPEPQTSSTIQSPKLPASKSSNAQYIVNTEPKPKPSNELTREYIPKVGMTTYTIVPQMSREKMRFFEVELTLERRNDAGVENSDSKTVSSPPGLLTNGTPALNGHSRSSIKPAELSQTIPPGSPQDDVFSPASPSGTEHGVKEKKVPPTVRPKPASFRLPPHKRTAGDYVSSAAVRRASVGSSSSGSSRCSSPAARPVRWDEEERERPRDVTHPEETEVDGTKPQHPVKDVEPPRFPPASCLTRQKSLPANPSPALSLDKLRSFAAPKPYSPSTPSRFAQAVLSAAKRSHTLTRRPLVHTSSVKETHEPPANTVTDNGEEDTERYRAAPSQTAGRDDPAPCSASDADMGTCKIENTQPSPGSEGSLGPSPTLKGISEASVEE